MEYVETIVLKEGINLHLVPDYKFKTFAISAYFHCPLMRETAALNALIPPLLRRGSRSYPSARQLSRRLSDLYGATMGGSVMKWGREQILSFYAEGIASEFLPDGTDVFLPLSELFFELLREPNAQSAFPEETLALEVKNLKHAILGRTDDKRVYAMERTMEETFFGKPEGMSPLGRLEDLQEINGKTAFLRYQAVLHKAPIDIYVCGNFKKDPVLARMKELGVFFTARTPWERPKPKPFSERTVPQNCAERMENLNQARLAMAFHTGVCMDDPEYFPLLLLSGVLGGGVHSKLFRSAREEQGLCYGISSGVMSDLGVLTVEAGMQKENLTPIIETVNQAISDIRNGRITEEEWNASVLSLQEAYHAVRDHLEGMEEYCFREGYASRPISPDDAVRRLSSVTLEEVMQVAKKLRLDTVFCLED